MNLAQLHCHTHFSNSRRVESLISPEKLLSHARKKGIAALAITDHNTFRGYEEALTFSDRYGVVLIPAVEIDARYGGQILAYGVTSISHVGCTPQEIIDEVHGKGGIACIAHPYDTFRGMKDPHYIIRYADGLEIYNAGAFWNRSAQRLAQSNPSKIGLASSDAHSLSLLDDVVLEFPDDCRTPIDYLQCLRASDFTIRVNKNYYVSLVKGGTGLLMARAYGFVKGNPGRNGTD